jgi:hypothetical protein
MTIKHVFSAGKYYVGDPRYAVKDENWSSLCDSTYCFGSDKEAIAKDHNFCFGNDKQAIEKNYNSAWNGLFLYNNKNCFTDSTKYGDGVFFDNYGHEFGVDAGLIGIMPLEICDGDSMEGGQTIEFPESFEVWANDGEFHFGDVVIQTGDDTEEEEDLGGDLWDDEYYENEEDEEWEDDSEEDEDIDEEEGWE